MRRDSLDELTCADELHGRNLNPANTIFKLWPPAKLEDVSAQARWPAAEEALFREGFSVPAIAERLAVPFTMAKLWVWNDAPDGYRRNGERPKRSGRGR